MSAQPEKALSPFSSPVSIAGIFQTAPKPIEWLVRDRIQAGRGALVSGIGGSSKTRLIYHLAIGAALGSLPWDWEIVRTGKAVLVLNEDTADDVHRTLYHISQGLGLTKEQHHQVERNVTCYAMAGCDMKLLAKNERGTLEKTANFYDLQTVIDAIGGAVLVGIDPALSITEGDETNQNDQRTLGKMADDLAVLTGATVMLAAHSSKNSQQTDELSSHNSRGAGAITDAVRAEYAMRTMTAAEAKKTGITDLEERKRHVQLVATKGNHLPPSAYVPTWLRRGDHGVLGPADLEFLDSREPNAKDMEALAILREMAKMNSPKLSDWRERCIEAGLVPNGEFKRQEKSMQRIVNRLLEAGLIGRGFIRGVYQPVSEQ